MRIGKTALASAILGLFVMGNVQNAQADKVDDVINEGTLRCAVVLDFPPIGFRDANNQPAGFDVELTIGRLKVKPASTTFIAVAHPRLGQLLPPHPQRNLGIAP